MPLLYNYQTAPNIWSYQQSKVLIQEQAKMAELQGYTGKAIYSVWFGSAREERAVFVDEVKCVGCLKCALFAEKTFAVESVYGRARVVAQWADPEDKIQEAIESCPVDCISIVERSNLAALEFLMSKQPRGNVRVGAGNTVGTRVSNIFVDVEKFLNRYQDAMSKASKQNAKESEPQRKAKMSAIQAIRAVSNWLYWQSPNVGGTTSKSHLGLTRLSKSSAEPNVKKLKDAAATRKQARESGQPFRRIPSNYIYTDEYWIPSSHALPKPTKNSGSRAAVSVPSPSEELNQAYDENLILEKKRRSRNPIIWGVPVATATTAAVLVWLQVRDAVAGGLKEHVGGSMALDIVNSSWLQVILAGMAWYFIGVALVELVDAIQNKLQMHKK